MQKKLQLSVKYFEQNVRCKTVINKNRSVLPHTTIFQYFLLLGGFTLFLLLIVNLFYIPLLKLSVADFVSCAKKLINYGIQRMPGDVVLGLFFAVPTFIASNYFSLTIAGNIAFCLSMFNIIIAFRKLVCNFVRLEMAGLNNFSLWCWLGRFCTICQYFFLSKPAMLCCGVNNKSCRKRNQLKHLFLIYS